MDVYFEEQNIHSTTSDGELMLTILASYAQEESLSASENQKWQVRQQFKEGRIMNVRRFFGYKIIGGELIPDETTAPIVREIFQRAVNEETFFSKITAITATKNNTLIFYLADGTVTVKQWIPRSRRNSWTDEMKEAARQRALERSKQNGNN